MMHDLIVRSVQEPDVSTIMDDAIALICHQSDWPRL